jgi:thiosulfate reductase/polysulfide reductase chain A
MSDNTEIRKGWCGPCHVRCGMQVQFENGRAVKVQGDPNNPISRGALCRRGQLILEHLYNPARLNFPLKRAGRRGEGKWQQITWDQAMDEIAEKLAKLRDRYGAETLAFSRGTHRTYGWAMKRFLNLFGSPNMTGANIICMCPSHTVEWSTYGSFAMQDTGNARCIVIWGYQPSQSYPITDWRALHDAKSRGAKIIVVDPRRTSEAEMADLWLQVRPGTDVALMLTWLKIIIDENLYDREDTSEPLLHRRIVPLVLGSGRQDPRCCQDVCANQTLGNHLGIGHRPARNQCHAGSPRPVHPAGNHRQS